MIEIAKAYNVGTSTLGKWLKQYRSYGTINNQKDRTSTQVLPVSERFKHLLARLCFHYQSISAGDGAFDKTPVYEAVLHHSPDADIVIPPSANAIEKQKRLRRETGIFRKLTTMVEGYGGKAGSMDEEIIRSLPCCAIKKYWVILCIPESFKDKNKKL